MVILQEQDKEAKSRYYEIFSDLNQVDVKEENQEKDIPDGGQ